MDITITSPTTMAVKQFADYLCRHVDEALTEAIDERLGAGNWNVDGLRGRLTRVGPEEDRTTYCLDGQFLMSTHYATVMTGNIMTGTVTIERHTSGTANTSLILEA